MANQTLGLKNVNMLTKEQYNGIANVSKDELYAVEVKTYSDDAGNWYRIYPDGWCEQGGTVIHGTVSSYIVNLHKPMKDTKYTVMISPILGESDDTGGAAEDVAVLSGVVTGSYPYGKTKTALRLSTYSKANDGFCWEVKGYIGE
jgi:hypothetical protein